MNRSKHATNSTASIVGGMVLFLLVTAMLLDPRIAKYKMHLHSWEAAAESIPELNSFWEHAAQRSDTFAIDRTTAAGQDPLSWADYDFAWDVYTLHVDKEPEAEALIAARNRIRGFDESRSYHGSHYVELGFASQVNDHLYPTSEFITQVQTLHTSGLDAVLTQVPPKPEAPVYLPVTVWNWVKVFPRWFVLWVCLSWSFYGIHTVAKKPHTKPLYDQIVHVPGVPVARAILFAQTSWVVASFWGLEALVRTALASARGINTASDRMREMRHPNRAEIRRARRALKILKSDGAAPELIAQAEDILRQWAIIPADEAPMRHAKPSRRDRRLAAAASEVSNLHLELEADREATAAARPPRATVQK